MQPRKRPKIEQPDDQQQRFSDAEVSDETENVDTPSLGSEQQLQRLEQEDERSRRLAELRAKRSTELSAEEKHEKMRLTNRESAKKLRRKRTEQMQSLQAEVAALRAENASLQQRLRQAADNNMALVSVVRSLRSGGSGALEGSAAGSTSAASAPSVDTHALGSLLGLPTGVSAQSSSTQGPSSSLEALLQGMGSGSIAAPPNPAQPPLPPTSPMAGMPGGLAAAAAAALAAQQMIRQNMQSPVWPFQGPSQNRPPLPPGLHMALAAATNGPPLSALWPLMQQQGSATPWTMPAPLQQPQAHMQQQQQQQQDQPKQQQDEQNGHQQRARQQQQREGAGSLPSPASGVAGIASAEQFAAWLQTLGSGVPPPMGPDSSPVVLPPPLSLNLWPHETHMSMPSTLLQPAALLQGTAMGSQPAPAMAPGVSSLPPFLQTLLAAGLPLGAAAAAAAVAAQGSNVPAHPTQAMGDAAAHGSVEQLMALERARLQQQHGQVAAQQFPAAPAYTQASAAQPLVAEAAQLQRAGTMMSCTAEVCEPLPIRARKKQQE